MTLHPLLAKNWFARWRYYRFLLAIGVDSDSSVTIKFFQKIGSFVSLVLSGVLCNATIRLLCPPPRKFCKLLHILTLNMPL